MNRSPVAKLRGGQPSSSKGPSKQPKDLRDTLLKLAQAQLGPLMNDLFNHTDDALFERADRSVSNSDQQKYFESMRHIRLERDAVIKGFLRAVHQSFEALKNAPSNELTPDDDPDFDEVSLVQQDELEISVAISGIVSKVTSQHSLPIMQLTKRLDEITPELEVTEANNPLGPRSLGESFARALAHLQVDIEIRIILFKLFERWVMEQLADTYARANTYLAEKGVLPDLKRVRSKPPRTAPPRTSHERAAAAAAGHGGASDGVSAEFSLIQRLMSGGGGVAGGGTGGGVSAVGAGGAGVGGRSGVAGGPQLPALATDQLLGVLSQMQATAEAPSLEATHAPTAIDLSALLAGQAQKLTGRQDAGLQQADDDVVNFVGMLFDYILNDRNLAIPMKALISRLQIPIVKLAIMDKSFFERANHPARRLLNALSSAGIGWSSASELKRDKLYDTIERIVARVLDEFHANPGIFETLTSELNAFVRQDRKRTDIVEQRLRDTEVGKAKTTEAKRKAQNVINQKAAGLRLHPMVGRFISEVWSKVLIYLCLKHTSQSDEWVGAVEDLDLLLWSIQPLNTLEDVEQREKEQSGLLSRLRLGMHLINLPDDECSEALADLESHLKDISEHDRAFLGDEEPPAPIETLVEVPEVKLAEVPPPEPVGETVEPIHLATVDGLAEGRWVELMHDDQEKIRCKLATILNGGQRFVFVNRRGMKVAERTRHQMASEIERGELTVLEDSEVFDKALEAVIGNLRQLRASS